MATVTSLNTLIKDFSEKAKQQNILDITKIECFRSLLNLFFDKHKKQERKDLRDLTKEEPENIKIKVKSLKFCYLQTEPIFYNKMLKYYNNEYWVISLWVLMTKYAEKSVLSREILRAFIKNCISCTAIELLKYSKIDEKIIDREVMSSRIAFYKSVFSVQNILKQMRLKYRKKLSYRMKQKKWHKVSNIREKELNFDSDLVQIFTENNLSSFVPIIKFVNKYKSNDIQFNSLMQGWFVFVSNTEYRVLFHKILKQTNKN